jgi:hypothetical protein
VINYKKSYHKSSSKVIPDLSYYEHIPSNDNSFRSNGRNRSFSDRMVSGSSTRRLHPTPVVINSLTPEHSHSLKHVNHGQNDLRSKFLSNSNSSKGIQNSSRSVRGLPFKIDTLQNEVGVDKKFITPNSAKPRQDMYYDNHRRESRISITTPDTPFSFYSDIGTPIRSSTCLPYYDVDVPKPLNINKPIPNSPNFDLDDYSFISSNRDVSRSNSRSYVYPSKKHSMKYTIPRIDSNSSTQLGEITSSSHTNNTRMNNKST